MASRDPRDAADSPDGGAPKIAIPRLRKSFDEVSSAKTVQSAAEIKQRVSHACEPCRQRKTKCSGERPICKHCQDFKISCYYGDGKRDRAKNEMINLKARIDIYEHLLEQLKTQVDSAGQLAITKALHGSCAQGSSRSQHRDQICDGDSLLSAEVGSTGSMDHIKEDVNTDNFPYPTGYMGKSSEMAWIQRVAQQLTEDADNSPRDRSRNPSFSHATARGMSFDSAVVDEEYQFQTPTYHLDDLSVPLPSGPQIDPYLLPDRKIADKLIHTYFTTFHPSFPIVSRSLFMNQYRTLFETFLPPGSSKRWLAMLNLKFAIGALYSKLTNAEWKGNDLEHLKYFARARILCLDEGSMLEVADLQQVQVMGLAGMYLLASNQTNRAWNVIGLAIRFAQTLGLNLRNEVRGFDEVEKELRVRMWYGLYSIEYIICFMTGRPASIRNKDCSAPLPRPIDEDVVGRENFNAALRQYSEGSTLTPPPSTNNSNSSSNTNTGAFITPPSLSSAASQPGGSNPRASIGPIPDASLPSMGMVPPPSHTSCSTFPHAKLPLTRPSFQYMSSYFLEHTKLNRITAEVLSSLYSSDTINRSWSDIQGIISALELDVAKWKEELPPMWDFSQKRADQSFARERMALAFQYHNARILINRPCLCRIDYCTPNESNRSRGFNRSAASTCVGGARGTVALLSDEPDLIGLISVSPWWCLLHYLVSAGAILMVEISMRAEHSPQQADGLLSDAKKVVRWLRAMSKDNIMADRSCTILSKLLIISAPKIGGDTSDVERDLGSADFASADKRPDVTMEDGGHLPGIGVAIGEHAYTPLVMSPTAEPIMDAHDGFRGLLDDPFPFGNIPIYSPFDNLMGLISTHFHPTTQDPPEPHFSDSAPTFADTAVGFSPPQTTNLQTEENDRMDERLQKRLSRGVSNISLPPPPKFPEWAATDDFIMNRMCEAAAQHGQEDFQAGVGLVPLSPCSSPDKSRKRATDGTMHTG